MKNGDTVIVGNSNINGNDTELITIVTANKLSEEEKPDLERDFSSFENYRSFRFEVGVFPDVEFCS